MSITAAPTAAQIYALRAEAAAAGDLAMVAICDRANGTRKGAAAARREVLRVIRNVEPKKEQTR